MKQPEFFNPLSYVALSDSLSRAIMSSELYPMRTIQNESFDGFGIYALFYDGGFPAYRRLAEQNREHPGTWPIYIGVSAPRTLKGSQLDPNSVDVNNTAKQLSNRVRHHAGSIDAAMNLDIEDFTCRLLTLSFIWAPVAESAMIARYEPIWNSYITGFGNHTQGIGRAEGKQTRWDTLHPGRVMNGQPNTLTADQLIEEAESRLEEVYQRTFRV